MKYLFLKLLLLVGGNSALADDANTVYNFSFKKVTGEDFYLSDLKGKVVLIVNTASECGFTKQYAALQNLYETHKDQGFVVLAVPSNDFGDQEQGSDAEIQEFIHSKYGVTFPVMKKDFVTGDKANGFYSWAKKELGFGSAPKWNFHKYLVDRKGKLRYYFNSTTSPDSKSVVMAIKVLLNEQD